MQNIKMIASALVVSVTSAAATAKVDNTYQFQTIDYANKSYIQAWSMNNKGKVVASAEGESFLYDSKSGGVEDIPTPVGLDSFAVFAAADSGRMIGSANIDSEQKVVGFHTDTKGNYTLIEHPSANGFTQPRGTNNKGTIAGYYRTETNAVGFIYSPKEKKFTSIVPSMFTIAQGINAKEQVVGSAFFDSTDNPCAGVLPEYTTLGWVYNSENDIRYFTVNGARTYARGISDNGTVAGYIRQANGETKGFVTSELPETQCAEVTIDEESLLNSPEGNTLYIQHISNSGKKLVGQYVTNDEFKGFVATKG